MPAGGFDESDMFQEIDSSMTTSPYQSRSPLFILFQV